MYKEILSNLNPCSVTSPAEVAWADIFLSEDLNLHWYFLVQTPNI